MYIDFVVLKILLEWEFWVGMVEVIKYGVIWDLELFIVLEEVEDLFSIDCLLDELLIKII